LADKKGSLRAAFFIGIVFAQELAMKMAAHG
jgi:hypothetical protein